MKTHAVAMKNKISLDSKVGTFSEQSLEGRELSAAAVALCCC